MRLIISFAAAAVLLPTAAAAQKPADLLACAAIARDPERLACYDAAVADTSPQARAASQARAKETARIAAEEAAIAAAAAKVQAEADAVALAAAKREAFGAEAVVSRGNARFAPPPGELQELETGLTEILTNTSGLGVFLLENGQLWRQVDTTSMPNIRVGDRVKLTRAPLGGYHLNFLKQKRRVLVKRVR
nr:hypothetical protein [Polymorphobacter sp.]